MYSLMNYKFFCPPPFLTAFTFPHTVLILFIILSEGVMSVQEI